MRKLVVVFLLATLAATGHLAAEDRFAVRIDSRIGFGGLFKPGRWTPVELTLQNLGPDIRGTLAVELTRRDRVEPVPNVTRYVRDLDLAAGAVKSFSAVLPLETAVYPIKVVLTHAETIVIEEEVKLSGRGAPNALVVVLSRRPSLDFLLPVFNSNTERSLDLVYPIVEFLPNEWHGYDGVDLLVVHDARIRVLTPEQIQAIRGWVAAGGRMIVSAGAHLGPADSAALERLIEMEPEAVDVATVGDLGFGRAGLPVLESEFNSPAVVSRFVGSPPGIVFSRLGRGEIVLLPFDFAQLVRVAPVTSLGMWVTLLPRFAVLEEPTADSDDQTIVAAPEGGGLFDPSSRYSGIIPISMNRRPFESDLLATQLDLPLYNFPSRLLVGSLATSFLLIAVGLLFWTAHRTSPVRALIGAVTLVIIAGVASLTAHLALTVSRQPPEALAFSLEIAELGPADRYAVVTKDILLFSRQRADYQVEFDGSPVVVPLEYRGQVLQTGGPFTRLSLSLDRWGHENTVAFQIEELNIHARVQRGIGYVNVELHNESAVTVEDIAILHRGFPSMVGNLMPGEVVEHVVMGAEVGNWNEISWTDFVTTGELAGHRAQLLRDLASIQRSQDDEPQASLMVVGWTPHSMISSTVEPAFDRRIELNALVMHIGAETGTYQGGID